MSSGTQTATQCQTSPPAPSAQGWQNGNAGASQAHYAEGESISYRAAVTGVNSGDAVVLILGYDVIHSGVHAIDYLTDKNRWQTPETTVAAKPDDPCSGVSPCAGPIVAPIPAPTTNIHADPTKTKAGGCIGTDTTGTGPLQPVTSFTAIPAGQRKMEFFNVSGTPTIGYVGTAPDLTKITGDQEQQIQLTFTAAASQVEIAWGGHIARRVDWGCSDQSLSASGISGSPYHMRLKNMTVNGAKVNLGNQDRSLSAAAVPPPFTLIINKTAVNGDGTFSYGATGTEMPATFSITTSGGSGSQTFSDLTPLAAGGTRTVTETAPPPPDGFGFTSLSCSVTTVGDGNTAFSTLGRTVTVTNGGGGATLTCTYTNTKVFAPSVTTTLSDAGPINIGDSVYDNATINNATSNAGGTITYKLYSDSSCTTEIDDLTPTPATVVNGVAPASDSHQFNSAGTFYWQATYSGDANNTGPVSSDCTSETLVVNKNQPGNSTAQSLIPDDSFTLSGATADAGGTVDFYLFAPGDTCDKDHLADADFSESVLVNGNDTYYTTNASDANPFVATAVGTWQWLVIYSGDANNEGTTSDCVETFTIVNG